MARRRGLYETMAGEEDISMQEKLGETFGYNPEAQAKIEKRISTRRGEFMGGGRFAATTGATSGTIETGVGSAQ